MPTTLDVKPGAKFGALVVIRDTERPPGGCHGRWVWCRCDCGAEKPVRAYALVTEYTPTRTCGCSKQSLSYREKRSRISTTHGHARSSLGAAPSKEYRTWSGIIRRCTRPTEQNYQRYGGRGIMIHPEWRESFAAFLRDVGPCPSAEHSIDRIDPNGNYAPGNVRWVHRSQQSRNTRITRLIEFNGRRQLAVDWAKETGINRQTILQRIDHYGWSTEEALTTPVRRRT